MNNSEIENICFDERLKIDKIIWIAGQVNDISQDFEEFFDDLGWDKEEDIISKKEMDSIEGAAELLEYFRDRQLYGFLVKISTPFMKNKGACNYYSWGETTWKWFYTEEMDEEFFKKVVAWKESFLAKTKKAVDEKIN